MAWRVATTTTDRGWVERRGCPDELHRQRFRHFLNPRLGLPQLFLWWSAACMSLTRSGEGGICNLRRRAPHCRWGGRREAKMKDLRPPCGQRLTSRCWWTDRIRSGHDSWWRRRGSIWGR